MNVRELIALLQALPEADKDLIVVTTEEGIWGGVNVPRKIRVRPDGTEVWDPTVDAEDVIAL